MVQIVSRPPTPEYEEGWDRIFGSQNKKEKQSEGNRDTAEGQREGSSDIGDDQSSA